ncbi:MAG: hypothetical protein HRU09_14160 [Oligoflexales bacterium]|nr:hypothetical protein [Oligoflexales bacterium]
MVQSMLLRIDPLLRGLFINREVITLTGKGKINKLFLLFGEVGFTHLHETFSFTEILKERTEAPSLGVTVDFTF